MLNEDIILVGAGLVGSSLLAALKHSGLRIRVLETHIPINTQPQPETRPLTLNECSRRILETLGVWNSLKPWVEPITQVHVSEENCFGSLSFKAEEMELSALGYVVPADELLNQLYRNGAENSNIKFTPIQKLTQIALKEDCATVTVETVQGFETFSAQLIVAADGAQSIARELINIPIIKPLSGHKAIIFTVQLDQAHNHAAYERFIKNGVIAVLPLKNPNRCRIVWTSADAFACELQQWSDDQLLNQLNKAMHNRLGKCRLVERGALFPLETLLASEQIKSNAVLLGNSARTLYPLAAQGFNLGLRDSAALAEILVGANRTHQPIGSLSVLKHYVEWRQADQRWITGLTLGVSMLFESPIPGMKMLRAKGLLVTDLISPLKQRLAKRLLGLSGKLPKLALGIPL